MILSRPCIMESNYFNYKMANFYNIISEVNMIPQPIYEFKLVLVGESSVGKSSILSRFVDD